MMQLLVALLLGVVAALVASPAGAVGFQYLSVPDPDDQPLEVGIWYPSDTPAAPQPGALLPQTVAPDGRLLGDRLPLIIISHGSGGWFGGHVDTALALAEAGYVVAAPTHTGDNYRDKSGFGSIRVLAGRPRQVARVVEFMLSTWKGHQRLDGDRVGIFGFSAGGYTALIALGAAPDPSRIASYCAGNPDEPECRRTTERRAPANSGSPMPNWVHEPRLKAAVVAAPGLGFIFDATALARVSTPVQLWGGAEDDVVSPRSTEIVRRSLPSPPEFHLVERAGHYAFLSPCASAAIWCKDPPGFDRAEFHHQLNAAVVRFFDARLRGR
jgi:predicted dienelactone hydrolase